MRLTLRCVVKTMPMVVGSLLWPLSPVWADNSPSIIRDAEVEAIVRSYTEPVFRAGGINPDLVTVRVLGDATINSFVTTGNRMFLQTGLIAQAKTPNMLIGVIAHESGHVAGGHIIRMGPELQKASVISMLGLALGVLAGAASGRGDVAVGAMAAGQEAAMKTYFSFSRANEGSADSFAMKALDASHQSTRGLLQFFEYLSGQEILAAANQDPYVRTHPLTTDRVEALRTHEAASPWSDVMDSPSAQARHDRMLAKLFAFLEPGPRTFQRYPATNTSVPARYARAIAYYRVGELNRALPLIDGLIQEAPTDPYFHELRGQMLLENGRLPDARLAYEQANRLAPNEPLIAISLAQVLVAINTPETLQQALPLLKVGLAREKDNPLGWRLLGQADNGLGDEAHARYALAEYAMLVGDYPQAVYHAKGALRGITSKDPAWLRLQDITDEAQQEIERLKSARSRLIEGRLVDDTLRRP